MRFNVFRNRDNCPYHQKCKQKPPSYTFPSHTGTGLLPALPQTVEQMREFLTSSEVLGVDSLTGLWVKCESAATHCLIPEW